MNDLIDRQAAIDAIGEVHSLDYNGQAMLGRIKALPSAETVEIIYCTDCKYFEQYTDDGTFESVLKMHQWDGECSEWVGHTYMDWFCSRAERKTDG